jgi:hypothetical protein
LQHHRAISVADSARQWRRARWGCCSAKTR